VKLLGNGSIGLTMVELNKRVKSIKKTKKKLVELTADTLD
jgi:hypothetical protein